MVTLKSEREQHPFLDCGKGYYLYPFIFILVIKEEHNVKVGRKLYSKEDAY